MTVTRFVDADGVTLHARIDGQGPPVVLLHGFTGSGRSLAGLARGLRDAYTTIRIDLVGHGLSAAPAEGAAYRMPRCVEQLAAAMDALGVSDAHLLGYSMGGRTALALCADRPERVRSALLIGASAGIEDAAERAARVRADEELADRIERDGVPAFVDAWMAQPLFATQRRLDPAARDEARDERLANRPAALAASLRGMGSGAQPPLHARLAEIARPVRLVVGELDEKFRRIAADLAGRLPDARVEVVSGAGHAVHVEDPEAVLQVARRCFAESETRTLRRTFRPPQAPESEREEGSPWNR